MIKAVVFDWDGTLADTLPVHYMAFKQVLKDRFDFKPMDLYIREGKKSQEIIAEAAPGLAHDEVSELRKKKQELFRKLFVKRKLYPGVPELLSRLKHDGFMLGLVTGTVRRNIEHTLSRELMALFDHITTADDIQNSKPHPEPYQRCLTDLGVEPKESIAVENAPLGIQSAKAAGMTCIAIESTLPESYLKGADFVVKNLKEAGKLIESLASGSG